MPDGNLQADAMQLLTAFLDDGHILRIRSEDGPSPHLVVRVRVRDPLVEQRIREAVRPMGCRVDIALSW